MRMSLVGGVAVLLVAAGTATAQVTSSFQYLGSLPDPGSPATKLHKFSITLTATDPLADVGGFDLTVSSPRLHQIWNGATPTPTLDQANLLSAADRLADSHFLLTSAQVVQPPAFVASENGTTTHGGTHRLGTLMSSEAAAIAVSARDNSIDVIQVVLPINTTAQLTGEATSINDDEDIVLSNLTLQIPLPGDANFDNSVDLLDFDVWLANLNSSPTSDNWENGDWDASGLVDLLDFDIWLANLNSTALSFAALSEHVDAETFAMLEAHVAVVPEPTSATVLGLACVSALAVRRRR